MSTTSQHRLPRDLGSQAGLDLGHCATLIGETFKLDPAGTWLSGDAPTVAAFLSARQAFDRTSADLLPEIRAVFAQAFAGANDWLASRPIASMRKPSATFVSRGAAVPVDRGTLDKLASVTTNQSSDGVGLDAKIRRDSLDVTLAIHVPGIGTVILERSITSALEQVRFCPGRAAEVRPSFRDGAEVVEAHEAIWSDSTSTGAIAMAEGSIPSVKAIELQGRLLTISGACYGSSPSAEAWILVPIEQWRGPTLTHTQHCQAWDLGQLERGDLRGLVVSWAGRRFVLGALMQLVSPGRPDSHRGTAATGRRAAQKTEQMPLF